MRSLITLLFVFLSTVTFAQDLWGSFYQNSDLNESGQFTRNFIEFGPDGSLYLAETDRNNHLIIVKRYANDAWVTLGEGIPRNMGDWSKFDFVVAPDGALYLGNNDHIYTYNSGSDSWTEHEVIGYIGGLSAGSDGTLYFIHLEQLGVASYTTSVASFNDGEVTLHQPLFEAFGNIPAKFRELNQIIEQNGDFYVSFSQQSNNSIHVFTGNLTDGFTVLEASQLLPEFNTHNSTLFAGVASGSMAVSATGEITISLSATNGIVIKRYNLESDSWDDFTVNGIASQSAHFNQLTYDHEGVLHLIYDGGQSTGFIFKFNGEVWEHVGPTHLGFSTFDTTARAPHLIFDDENQACFVHGIGSMMIPLHIRKLEEGTWVSHLPSKGSLSVFPNPATAHITISAKGVQHSPKSQLRVFDAHGREVHSAPFNAIEHIIDVGGLPAGWYTLCVIDEQDGSVVRKRVVVTRR